MVHSALKRKRYSGDPAQSSVDFSTTPTSNTYDNLKPQPPFTPDSFAPTISQFSVLPPNPLLTPPPTNSELHPAPSAPSHDPRPSLTILLDLMTPAEFAKLLRARIKRLLTTWPAQSSQSQATHFLPSPTTSSSSSSSHSKDLQDTLDPSPAAVMAFVAFFRLEDVRMPFSFPDLQVHLHALQTLFSFLSSREIKEIVKARMNAEGDEQYRWIVVQGVLDVLRNAAGEDEGDDVEMEMNGVGGEVNAKAQENRDNHPTQTQTADKPTASDETDVLMEVMEVTGNETVPDSVAPTKEHVSGSDRVTNGSRGRAALSYQQELKSPHGQSVGIHPPNVRVPASLGQAASYSAFSSPTADKLVETAKNVTSNSMGHLDSPSRCEGLPEITRRRAASSPVLAQDADTDVDMDMSDDEETDGGLLVTVLENQNEKPSKQHVTVSKADHKQSPGVRPEQSHQKLVRQSQGMSKEFDKPSQREEAKQAPTPRLTITLPPRKGLVSAAASLPKDVAQDDCSDEPTAKRRRTDRARNHPPSPKLPTPDTSAVPPTSSVSLPVSIFPSAPPSLERRVTSRLPPRPNSLIKPAPTFVPARFTNSHVNTTVPVVDTALTPSNDTPAPQLNHQVQPVSKGEYNSPPSPISPKTSTLHTPRTGKIMQIKQEIGESLGTERKMKEKVLISQSKYCDEGSASCPILILDTPSGLSDTLPDPSTVPRTIPSAPRPISSVASGPRSIFVAPTGDPIGPISLPADPSRTLRPEGPEPPPPFEAKPLVTSPNQAGISSGKSCQVNTFAKRSSFPVRRGRSRSRSESSRSCSSDSNSRSSSPRRRNNQVTRHRLPRRQNSPSPMRRRRTSRTCSSSRSRSRRRSRSSSPRRYRSRRSGSPSRSKSPAYRRRPYSYSRPPSPSDRRESPVRHLSNRRHWSPGDERLPRGRFDKRNRSPTPSRIPPSRDHWSPGTDGNSRRTSGANRARKDVETKGYEKISRGGDVLARPMTDRDNPHNSFSKGTWNRK